MDSLHHAFNRPYSRTVGALRHAALLPLLLLLPLLDGCSPAESTRAFPSASPSELGFDAEALTQVDRVFEQAIDSGWIAGGAAMVTRGGSVALRKAWGWQDMETSRPMRPDHLFRIASQTKAVTSVAILQLAEQGALRFDDPVSRYIPEFAEPKVLERYDPETGEMVTRPASREVTLHDLLTHTSGIQYGFNGSPFREIYDRAGIPDLGTEQPRTIEQTMAALGRLPLAHDPGERFTYGLNTDVLGRVVEVASGMPLDAYFRTRIFDPLGMRDTGFYLPGREDDLTTLYTTFGGELIPMPYDTSSIITPDFPVQGAMTYFSGGAGLTSTVRDYSVFLQALAGGGSWNGSNILSPESVELMATNQLGDLRLGANAFGYGLEITTPEGAEDGLRPVGSLSWGGAFQTTYWIDPAHDMVVVMMTQVLTSPHRNTLYDRFEQALYAAVQPQAGVAAE
jgi:CubicO group peptidase (beta-lactamase class C family)